jgi:hypothetical protein
LARALGFIGGLPHTSDDFELVVSQSDSKVDGENHGRWLYHPNKNVQSIFLKNMKESLKSALPDGDDARILATRANEIWELFR